MNFTQSFEEFSKGVGPTDLILYAGVAIVVWVLFKDRLSPIQKLVMDFINSFKAKSNPTSTVSVSSTNLSSLFNTTSNGQLANPKDKEDLFFKLIVSWKETRDLAVKCGCSEAVEVADNMFPYLSPNVCGKDK